MKKVFATLIAMLMLAVPAMASDGGNPYEGTEDPSEAQCPDYTVYVPENAETESSAVYVAKDELLSNGYLFSIWVFGESNGNEGLQRWDGYCTNEGVDNVGAYAETHDLIIF